jgi:glycosyltransferase involved in cell wall biosynthesis
MKMKKIEEGLIIKPKNEKQLKEAIVKLMETPKLRKKLERNARKKALERDLKKMFNIHYHQYQLLIKNYKGVGL